MPYYFPQPVQAQPAPAPSTAQTVTFVTPDGMLVTQTITPLQTEPQPQPQQPVRAPLQVCVNYIPLLVDGTQLDPLVYGVNYTGSSCRHSIS